jgi:MFS family permease
VILAVACLVGLALACAAGARPWLLLEVHLRWTGLVVAALALQLAVFAFGVRPPAPLTITETHLASYALLIVFAARNVRIPGFMFAAAGLASNALVIFANGGRMPVAHAAAVESGSALHGIRENVVSAAGSTRLPFLGDVFAVPQRFPLANTFSIGDVLLVAGFTLFVYTNGRATWDRSSVKSLAPLRVRAFRVLLGARMVSKLGDWISIAALVTWIYAHSHSTGWVSAILLARLTASISGSLISGVLLGRNRRFAILAFVEAARALATLAAVAAVAVGQPLAVAACVFVSSLLVSATDPTASSLVVEVLPQDELHAGNALHALARAVAMAIGSLGGGLLAAKVGAIPALLSDAGTFAVALLLYALMTRHHVPAPTSPVAETRATLVGRLEAFAIVCRRRRLVGLVGSFAAATCAMGVVNASLPSFLAHRAPRAGGYGVAMAMIAAGLICGEYLSGRAPARVVDRIPALGFAATAATAAIAASSHSSATILLLLFGLGIGDGTTEAAYDTIVQREAPLPAVDRVFAVASAVQQSGMVAGLLLAGLAQRLLGPSPLGSAAIVLGIAVALAVFVVAREQPRSTPAAIAPDVA